MLGSKHCPKCFTCLIYLNVIEKRKYKVVVKISGLGVILSVFKSFKEALHLAKKAQRAGPEVFQTSNLFSQ